MSRFAIQMVDGSVAIMETVGDATPEACLAKWPQTERAKVVSTTAINPAAIPADRTFRGAWSLSGSAIAHDMAKARTIHADRLRAERVPLFAKLDAEWMKAVGQGDTVTADVIEAKRQALRDIPQSVAADLAAASTPEALKAIRPDALTADAVVAVKR